MTKRDRLNGDQPKSDTLRRDILTMSIAVAPFGAAMGVSLSTAGAEPADTFLKIPTVKGERANKQNGSAKKTIQ